MYSLAELHKVHFQCTSDVQVYSTWFSEVKWQGQPCSSGTFWQSFDNMHLFDYDWRNRNRCWERNVKKRLNRYKSRVHKCFDSETKTSGQPSCSTRKNGPNIGHMLGQQKRRIKMTRLSNFGVGDRPKIKYSHKKLHKVTGKRNVLRDDCAIGTESLKKSCQYEKRCEEKWELKKEPVLIFILSHPESLIKAFQLSFSLPLRHCPILYQTLIQGDWMLSVGLHTFINLKGWGVLRPLSIYVGGSKPLRISFIPFFECAKYSVLTSNGMDVSLYSYAKPRGHRNWWQEDMEGRER